MTEAEWLACTDTWRMLSFLSVRASERKLRLFACARSRQFWDFVTDARCRDAIEVAERYADYPATRAEFSAVATLIWESRSISTMGSRVAASTLAVDGNGEGIWDTAFDLDGSESERDALYVVADKAGDLLRCIFGNSFQFVSAGSFWLTPTIIQMAQAAYHERKLPSGILDNALLAILADALEEAGCTDAAILDHCRSPGPHVRGCWVVDLLLGKQ